ncbi:MAG: transcription termination/antitermination factor NusG [Ruminococcaceae bacterium]|nr:transcription termination/antitermination factor NusG [Oscillospiraceae bacterium]
MSDINATHLGPRWYVAHTYSGYENKVKANLEKIIENRGLGHLIFEVVIPIETVVEKDGDEEKEVENKVFPSYVLIKMIMSDESWHVVRNIRGVTGFVGPGSHPTPLTDEEVEALNVEAKSFQLSFGIGDQVVINKGIFAGYKGRVEEISEDMKTVTVLVATGRRETPVYVDVSDVKADKSAN